MPEQGFWNAHQAACERGDFTYKDPETGYIVFTRLGLLERERCCGAGCRHCPFGHDSVKLEARAGKIQQAAWLSAARPVKGQVSALLFWSGGKDSFLAYRALAREPASSVALLTTFDARSRIVAHQEFPIDVVAAQADHLDLPIIGVPLHAGGDYVDQVATALHLIPDCSSLCFGDLHLEHIREWREGAFAAHPRTASKELSFPLWNVGYDLLLADLNASGAVCIVSAVAGDIKGLAVGDHFDANLIALLPDHIDRFGENGEFHTRVEFPDAKLP